jgi:hypothetical protein
MPESAVPVVAAIVLAFLTFIVVVGGVSIWTWLPARREGDQDRRDPRATEDRSSRRGRPGT